MRRLLTYTTVVLVALVSTVAVAQKVTNADELDKTMKRIAPAQGATGKAIQSMSWADAKAQVAIVKQALTDTESFWAANKKDDAVAMLKDSVAKVTAVEQALERTDARSAGRPGGVQAGRGHVHRLPQAVPRAGRKPAVQAEGWLDLRL